MLLSRKFATYLGESLQMNLSYATIPILDGTFVRLDRKIFRRYHVAEPNQPKNEFINMLDEYLSSHVVLTFSLAPGICGIGMKECGDEVLHKDGHIEGMQNQPWGS
jgi:hypothetical protein